MKTAYIIANWKMNPSSLGEARELVQEIAHDVSVQDMPGLELVLCPPFVYLGDRSFPEAESQAGIALGAQDCFWQQEGAYTGEISPTMLANLGCEYVILGHSERKQHLGETEAVVNKKLKAALSAELTPVLCIGEARREEGREEIERQMRESLEGVPEDAAGRIIFAYEPRWAISTQEGAQAVDPAQAKSAIAFLREVFARLYGETYAGVVPVLYGGSVNGENVKQFLSQEGIDGALAGGVSLRAQEFTHLVKNAMEG